MVPRRWLLAMALVAAWAPEDLATAQQASRKRAQPVNSEPRDDALASPKTEKATFGGGCFWCLEAVFEQLHGVKNVVSGYAGGRTGRPNYGAVSTGMTGHAEVIQIEFDPGQIAYKDLLDVFWACHDPTTLNRQGPDEGTQYRSIILYHDEAQRKAALESYQKVEAAGLFQGPIVTELVPLKTFTHAEKHHQNYYRNNKFAPYCQMVITPKLRELQAKLGKVQKATKTAEKAKPAGK